MNSDKSIDIVGTQLSDINSKGVYRHVSAEGRHDMEETLATLTEDCLFEDLGLGRTWYGREGAREYYQLWWDAFGVVPETSTLYGVTPDQFVVELRFKGKHIGRFLGIEPTGKSIDLSMALFVEMRDGKLTGERFYWNIADLYRQLGVTKLH